MIKIKCLRCGEMADIGRICRECGATVPAEVYQGAKDAEDAYGKIQRTLTRLGTFGQVDMTNIGAAVQLYRECADILQKLEPYQSFFQGDFDSLKTKSAVLDNSIQGLQKQYNDEINALISNMNVLVGNANESNLKRAQSLSFMVERFRKPDYDTGQYAALQSKKNELDAKFVTIEAKINARKQINVKKIKRLVLFLVYWGILLVAVISLCIQKNRLSGEEINIILSIAFAIIGGIIGFVIFFRIVEAGAGTEAIIFAVCGLILGGILFGIAMGKIRYGILGAIAGAIAGAIVGAIVGAIDGLIDRVIDRVIEDRVTFPPVIGSVLMAGISGLLVGYISYAFLLKKITPDTGIIIVICILFVPLLLIYIAIQKGRVFTISPALISSAGGYGLPVTVWALPFIAVAAVFVWFTNHDVSVFQSRFKDKDMVLMPGGTFSMGSPATEPAREPNEGPQHQVTVSSFYMGKKEVTVGEFRQFVNATNYTTTAQSNGGGRVVINDNWQEKADASWENPYFSQTNQHPVVLVSWYDAVEYCNWRSEQKGLSLAYSIDGSSVTCNWNADGYRLPTEAEWEYACRAGTNNPFSAGDNITTSEANYDGNSPYDDNEKGEYREASTETLTFDPNPWGLYDMHGNVYEWCWDAYGNYGGAAQTDPKGPAAGANRVARGGSWYRSGKFARSASRVSQNPTYRDSALGFRLVLPNRDQKTAENTEAAPVPVSDGVYTFSPRLQGVKGRKKSGQWLAKIEIQNGAINLYLVDKASGKGTKTGLSFGPPSTLILQDLDNPAKKWQAAKDAEWDEKNSAWVITFRGVTSRRLNYIETQPDPDLIIKKIILGDPDK